MLSDIRCFVRLYALQQAAAERLQVTYLDAEEGVNVSLDFEAWPGMYMYPIHNYYSIAVPLLACTCISIGSVACTLMYSN
jgi:hypothetical protein